MIAVQTSCHAVVRSPITPVLLSVLSCHQEKPPWDQAEAAVFYRRVYAWVRVPQTMYNWLVPELDHPGGQWTGCSLLHSPFLEAHRSQGCRLKWQALFLSLSLFQSFLSFLPFSLPWCSPLPSHPLHHEDSLFVSLSFCHWRWLLFRS